MSCERDEEILYLAHQLWEEDDTPSQSCSCYWTLAAQEILASGPSRTQVRHLHNTHACTRIACDNWAMRIEVGHAVKHRCSVTTKGLKQPKAANANTKQSVKAPFKLV
jgi:hypothetical protein